MEHPGHLYFDGLDLHSSHSVGPLWILLFETLSACSSVCDKEADMFICLQGEIAGATRQQENLPLQITSTYNAAFQYSGSL